MARTRERSRSPDPHQPLSPKRFKVSHPTGSRLESIKPAQLIKDAASKFHHGLFDHQNISRHHSSYESSGPFKHAVVDKLFQDELLKNVKDECLTQLSFTEKETDIYKVNQTGDLASLNFLSPDQLARLPNILALRDALYSKTFRDFLQAVTGCGPLSGTKQDMSVNTYTRGCHLLNHDDVIGTRRVSYILYMPLPNYQMWQKDWGGALELYPVRKVEGSTSEGADQWEPEPIPSKSIPPSWNQFIFFEVQPGKSFHSVEEVVVGGDGRERLSISGWFHTAQEGEEGYVSEPPSDVKSSREQLKESSTVFTGYPGTSESDASIPDGLTSSDVAFLSEFLNPVYLQHRTMKALANRFVEESSLELHSFLCNDIAESLETRLRTLDIRDGLSSAERGGKIPGHTTGLDGPDGNWEIRGPPHKWRYCHLKPRIGSPSSTPPPSSSSSSSASAPAVRVRAEAVTPRAANPSAAANLRSLQDELFTSTPFRKWLSLVTRLVPMRHWVEARRFRPGLDYTLAMSEESEARLDVVLGLTPGKLEDEPGRGKYGWQSADWGGWECYMAPHDEEDDPAVYRSSVHKKAAAAAAAASSSKATTNGNGNGKKSNGHDADSSCSSDHSMSDVEMDEEEDSTLLTVLPGFNRLLLVLRDERVMRFVKYVSAAADGSRWDVCGEYEVGMVQEDDSGSEGSGGSERGHP